MQEHSLLYYLEQVEDDRIQKGRRYPLWVILGIIIMAVLSGRKSLKSIGRFVVDHKTTLQSLFNFETWGTLLWNNMEYFKARKFWVAQ